MLTPGMNPQGGVALRKVVHEFLVQHPVQAFRPRDIASRLNLTEKQVTAVLAQVSGEQQAALNYPHVHRVKPGHFAYDPSKPQRFTVKKKKPSKPVSGSMPNVVQPMADYTVEKDAIVLKHRSGRLFIARPID